MASEGERKRQVMEHLSRSLGTFNTRSTNAAKSDRKQQIMDHVRRSKG